MRTPALTAVRKSYGSFAQVYIERVGSTEVAPAEDREVIRAWADGLHGPVLDAGCGPGHWSGYLRRRGLEVEGVDATPEFLAHARSAEPGIPFRLGDLRTLEVEDRSLGGVLAWFSLIHTDPEEVPAVLRRFASALRPDASILLGFFSADELHLFDHRVVTAWAWPVDRMAEAVEAAGLVVRSRREWPTPNGRRNASIVASRPSGDDMLDA